MTRRDAEPQTHRPPGELLDLNRSGGGSPDAVARLALHYRAWTDKGIELLVALRTELSRIAEECGRAVPGVSRAVEVFSDRGPLDDVT
ncbi:hypothetical protein VQ02_15300 [Methylobacterium variabile]|uniref:Uncharacterized protein n=1 Tax=Methylobacterium variabile TaxID=298794 RepID=A0A0J6SMW4_9HYPH|nr:hypothetical protein [Methylobacterium variabile]KMO36540.1 hypothetical protein VQ02_15300 [Methylobacterium variabile]